MKSDFKYLHEYIFDDLKRKILSHEYAIGAQIPKEMDLVSIYDTSRHTIRKVLERLKTEGYLYTVKGSGTYIQEKKADFQLSKLKSFSELVQKQKAEPNSIVLSAKLITAPEKVAKELRISENEKCYFIERIRKSDDILMCYEKTYISATLCPDIDKFITPNTSTYDLYENKYKLNIDKGKYDLEAINACDEIAEILKIKKNEAVLYMKANVKLVTGETLYYVDAYYVGSRYVFTSILQR